MIHVRVSKKQTYIISYHVLLNCLSNESNPGGRILHEKMQTNNSVPLDTKNSPCFFLLTDSRRSHLVLIGENWLVKIGWAWHVMTGLGTPGICTYWPLSRKQPFWHFLTLSSCWIPSTKKKQPNLPCGKTHLTQSSWPNKVPKNKWPRPPGHSWHKGDFTYETH